MPARSILMIFIGLAVIPGHSSADCPTNYAAGFGGGHEQQIQSTSAIWNDGVLGGDFSLNLILGTAQLTGSGGGGEQSGACWLNATDLYQIVGPASADPIPFEVRAQLTGSVTASLNTYPFIGQVCDGVSVQFHLSSGAAFVEFTEANSFQPCAGKTIDADLALPLAKLPGESFPVQYHLQSNNHGGVGTIRGEVAFANLPAGYSIVSCQGYVGQPVASLPTSWGRLKQAYR
jgi:hypothetical protein